LIDTAWRYNINTEIQGWMISPALRNIQPRQKEIIMRAEVSCLFRLEYQDDVVKEAHIGSGVYLKEVSHEDWLKEAIEKNDVLQARQKLDYGPYTHRLYISIDGVSQSSDPQIAHAKQLIARAIVLSRVVHPNPIATRGTWIESFFSDSGNPFSIYGIEIGHYGRAYLTPEVKHGRAYVATHARKTITQDDAMRMAELWEPLQYLFNNEEKYRRIIRALKFFDAGYHLWNVEFKHIVFFAALTALICTGREFTKAQVAQRLPKLVPDITERQAVIIYNLSEDIAHTAAAIEFDMVPDEQEKLQAVELVRNDQERLNAAGWLEKALSSLLERAISDRTFADLLADRSEFAHQYPFEIKQSNIGQLIIRDSGVRGGRPIIAGTGITVHRIASWYKLGLRPEEIAGRIGHLTLAQVYAALTYYHANRDEIDAEIAAEEAEADRLEQEHYLSLQSRS
jgi:uncharacterized protein (DUF433 family)